MSKKITQNVNKDKFLNDLPKVVPEKTKWGNRHTNYQSCNLSQIIPIYYEEILPNEIKEIRMGMISHTTTPIAPIFNSLYTEIRSFFIPSRLCADLLNGYKSRKSPWVKVFGEDPSSSDASIIVPLTQQKLPDASDRFIAETKYYLSNVSVDDNLFDSLDMSYADMTDEKVKDMNFLALAAYELVYQRHYRNENYESATQSALYRHLYDAYNQTGEMSERLNPDYHYFHIANREKDYFTGMKPFTQKSTEPIYVNIGEGLAKLKADSETYTIGGNARLGSVYTEDSTVHVDDGTLFQDNGELVLAGTGGTGAHAINRTNIKVDLSSAQGISVEELRILVKTQELLEKDALYGSLYAESLNAHFGCCPLDLTLQDPQELFKTTITSQMQAIFQTSTTTGESSILGTIGANSTTQTDPFIIVPRTKFMEHGILLICAVHKLQNVYDSRFFKPKFNFKKSRFDFYTPELNDLGFQPVTDKEMVSNSSPIAGYNEAFAEYRYVFNKCHGSLNKSFPFWAPSIAGEYSSASTLYKEDPDILDKALSQTSAAVPQFYDAWGFEVVNDKPMSLHSLPGFDGVI